MKRQSIVLLLAVAAGCTVGPEYREPRVPVPDQFGNGAQPGVSSEELIGPFWKLFNDDALNRLVEDALSANKDLARAASNLRAARAAARLVGYDAFPTVTSNAAYARTLASSQQQPIPAERTRDERTRDTFDVGFDATWELDFFGRVRRSTQAARAAAGSAEATLQDAIVIVTAEVTRNYCVLRGLQDQLTVAERNAANQTQTLELTQTRLAAGRGTELDVARAAAQLATTEASIPPLRSSISNTIHRISVLTGRQPEVLVPALASPRAMPTLPTLSAVGDPQALLRRRPDVRIAERNLAAQTARIGIAVADLFPRVTFFGSAGYDAGSRGELGTAGSQTYAFGPSITWAAFDLGRVRARIASSRADADGAFAAYEAAVLNALEDTESSLVNYGDAQRRQAALERAATQSRKAARLALQRFEGGLTDFLAVLQAERDALAAEDSLSRGRTQTATALVAVYKALGGGWMVPR